MLVDKIINKKTVQKYIQDRAYIAVDSKESDKVSNNNSSYYEINEPYIIQVIKLDTAATTNIDTEGREEEVIILNDTSSYYNI